jgi:hypothetical protein
MRHPSVAPTRQAPLFYVILSDNASPGCTAKICTPSLTGGHGPLFSQPDDYWSGRHFNRVFGRFFCGRRKADTAFPAEAGGSR